MEKEKLMLLVEKGVQESSEKMYKEMTSDFMRRIMFRYACSKSGPL